MVHPHVRRGDRGRSVGPRHAGARDRDAEGRRDRRPAYSPGPRGAQAAGRGGGGEAHPRGAPVIAIPQPIAWAVVVAALGGAALAWFAIHELRSDKAKALRIIEDRNEDVRRLEAEV